MLNIFLIKNKKNDELLDNKQTSLVNEISLNKDVSCSAKETRILVNVILFIILFLFYIDQSSYSSNHDLLFSFSCSIVSNKKSSRGGSTT